MNESRIVPYLLRRSLSRLFFGERDQLSFLHRDFAARRSSGFDVDYGRVLACGPPTLGGTYSKYDARIVDSDGERASVHPWDLRFVLDTAVDGDHHDGSLAVRTWFAFAGIGLGT